jgi:hypothetical protein
MDEATTQTAAEILAERLRLDSAVPADCTDDELARVDFARRDVLIGTVRSDVQFDYTMASLSYYAPVRTIPADCMPPRLVALYEEGLTTPSGIRRYGKITEIRVVKRGDIPVPQTRPNSEEAYYLFSVESWTELEPPVLLAGTGRGKPAFTTEFLLTHARRSYQLVAIRSAAEYRLTQALCGLCEEAVLSPAPLFRRIGRHHLLCTADGFLSLVHARGEVLFRVPLRAVESDPVAVLDRVATQLGLRG